MLLVPINLEDANCIKGLSHMIDPLCFCGQALVKKLVARGISVGRPQGILHARVPIIKFVDARSGKGLICCA